MTQEIFLASVCYVTPKIISYLCSPPNNADLNKKMDFIRIKLSDMQYKVECLLGDRSYRFLTEVIGENAWVSILVISMLKHYSKQSLLEETKISKVSGFISFASLSWLIRYEMGRNLPYIGPFVAPSSIC